MFKCAFRNRKMDTAIQVCREMLEQRGYSDVTQSKIDQTLVGTDDQRSIIVFFSDEPKLVVSAVRNYIRVLTEVLLNHAIIVHEGLVTPSARDAVVDVVVPLNGEAIEFEIELFSVQHLLTNITKHVLVPDHTKVTCPQEIAELASKRGHLNKILTNDAVARFLHFQPGDLIRVTRKNGLVEYAEVEDTAGK